MVVLLSGEGPTDLGVSASGSEMSTGEDLLPGPMAWMVDHLIEARLGYSVLDVRACVLIGKGMLVARATGLKQLRKKSLILSGKKKAKETAYFFQNARTLAAPASELSAARNDEDLIAVLFRDSDGTASAGRGLWEEKRQSMLNGFAAAGFSRGVAMIPRPKSEAWLLCALRANPYTACDFLEARSGNDDSPNNLKDELEAVLGEPVTRDLLAALVARRAVDVRRIEMPSFVAFRDGLHNVL